MWVGGLIGEPSTWAAVCTEVEAVARMLLAELEAAPAQIPPLMQSRLTSQWGASCSPSSRWQGVAAAKFSGLPGLTTGGSSTYLPRYLPT